MIISSVVPPVLDMLQRMADKYFHVDPLIVGPDIETGMPVFMRTLQRLEPIAL
jgi:type III pantothenate kinase